MPTVKSESPESFETLIALSLEELKKRSITFVKTSKAAEQLRLKITKTRPQAGSLLSLITTVARPIGLKRPV